MDFQRGIGTLKNNRKVLKQLKNIFEKSQYSFIHTHSPLASVFSRLFAFRYSIPVIYTAHGFQFFKKGPIKDWIFYFPIEYLLSFITDLVITINQEDYKVAQKMHFKNVEYISGVGIDCKSIAYSKVNRSLSREDLGFSKEDIIILSVGELSKRKNHETIIKSLVGTSEEIKYLICGTGELQSYLSDLVEKLGLSNRIKLMGYRTDVFEIMNISDIFAFPSKREGLGLAAIEAMACGLPIITSNINGINDYSINGRTGYSCTPDDINTFRKYIKKLAENKSLRNEFSLNNISFAQKYDKALINKKMEKLYIEFVGDIK